MIKIINDEKVVIPFINTLKDNKYFLSPMYTNEEEINHNLIKRIKHPDDLVIAVYDDETIIGVFSIFIEKEEKYMEVLLCFSTLKKAYDEVFEYLEVNYPGYQCDIVANPNNYILIDKLKELNAKFDIQQNYMKLAKFREYKHNLKIVKYEEKYKEQYIKIHSVDRYWIAEKVINALDKFNVFLALNDDEVIGYIDVSSSFETNEPYDLLVLEKYRNKGYGKALLSEAIKANFPKQMDLTVDIDNESGKHLYEQLGFIRDSIKDSVCIHLNLN